MPAFVARAMMEDVASTGPQRSVEIRSEPLLKLGVRVQIVVFARHGTSPTG